MIESRARPDAAATSGALTCDVAAEPPVVVVRARGGLCPSNAPTLCAALLKALAQSPDAVVVDVAGLVVVEDIAVTVFAAAARHAAAWPGVPVLLCAASPTLAAALARTGVDRQVAVLPELATARAHGGHRRASPQVRDRLNPTVTAIPTARRILVEACTGWRLAHLVDPASLVISELVTNAVRHAETPVELALSHRRQHLHLAVRDYAHQMPRLMGPVGQDEPGGRGLLLVDALATYWGYIPTADGKVVWATFRTAAPGAWAPDGWPTGR